MKPSTLALTTTLLACGGAPSAQSLVRPPEYAPAGETKCGVTRSHSSPLIVEWPSTERAKLESLARGGVLPVQYSGCQMKTLSGCKARSTYRYVALTPKHDVLRMSNQDELYAAMPVYAASFEGKLKQAGELSVTMTIVGRFEAEQTRFGASDLEGDCSEATHVIAAITAGAFRFAAGGEAEVKGGVSVLGAGAGARSAAARETLAEDGDEKACAASTEGAAAPPFGCGAFLRLEVVPVAMATRAAPAAPASKPRTTDAPRETPREIGCPAGAHVQSGKCVADSAPSARFAIAGDTVVDAKTKLSWQRAPDPTGVAWKDAKTFCAGLTAGGGGWRLPTKEELVGVGENLPAGIDRAAFPAVVDKERSGLSAVVFYWSATPHAVSETMAWGVRYGSMGAQPVMQSRASRNLVRCVKG